jgi:tripartite-type tricarboxylate transporter receptor subunit TctC
MRAIRKPSILLRTTAHQGALLSAVIAAGALAPLPTHAQPVADFYKGKTINLLIGVGVGGEYDLHARLSGRHIGKHIPGNPTVVPQNMTGAGGLKMANYLYTVAPKDGTSIGMMANNFPMMQAVGAPGVQFDATKMQWIGSISPTVETMAVWHTAGVTSIEQARQKEIVVGATGRGAITFTFPTAMNEFLGTKFKIVTGYEGGNAINLAMERGEVQARDNTWSSWKVTKADWLRDKKIVVIAYAGPKPKDLPGVPSLSELAKSDDDRKILDLVNSGTEFGRPLATTDGVPSDRVKALRDAFMATMADKEFLAEAEKLNIEVDPVRGEHMQELAAKLMTTPKNLADRARAIVE